MRTRISRLLAELRTSSHNGLRRKLLHSLAKQQASLAEQLKTLTQHVTNIINQVGPVIKERSCNTSSVLIITSNPDILFFTKSLMSNWAKQRGYIVPSVFNVSSICEANHFIESQRSTEKPIQFVIIVDVLDKSGPDLSNVNLPVIVIAHESDPITKAGPGRFKDFQILTTPIRQHMIHGALDFVEEKLG